MRFFLRSPSQIGLMGRAPRGTRLLGSSCCLPGVGTTGAFADAPVPRERAPGSRWVSDRARLEEENADPARTLSARFLARVMAPGRILSLFLSPPSLLACLSWLPLRCGVGGRMNECFVKLSMRVFCVKSELRYCRLACFAIEAGLIIFLFLNSRFDEGSFPYLGYIDRRRGGCCCSDEKERFVPHGTNWGVLPR